MSAMTKRDPVDEAYEQLRNECIYMTALLTGVVRSGVSLRDYVVSLRNRCNVILEM